VTYVPIPIVPPTPPSPRTRELADLLARVIEEYEKHHPTVSGAEVREALNLASRSSKAVAPAAPKVLALLLLGLAALGAGLFLAVERSGGGAAPEFPMIAVVIGVILVLGLVAVIKGRRNL
jgi:hypothetical protein